VKPTSFSGSCQFLISALAFLFLGSQAWAQASNTVTRDTDKGKVLVDNKGMTLYMFDKDTREKSMCNATCAQNWRPLPGGRQSGSRRRLDSCHSRRRQQDVGLLGKACLYLDK
jgi:predicted lipoprotein with Yx(FWY)xxD motif